MKKPPNEKDEQKPKKKKLRKLERSAVQIYQSDGEFFRNGLVNSINVQRWLGLPLVVATFRGTINPN